jgi:hypothetical protein
MTVTGAIGTVVDADGATTQDRAMTLALQRRMIREHPCRKVVELDADHAPFFSATDELVAALDALAEQASRVPV